MNEVFESLSITTKEKRRKGFIPREDKHKNEEFGREQRHTRVREVNERERSAHPKHP